jgi:hypothetical protein
MGKAITRRQGAVRGLIREVRGQRVILDFELASVYSVSTMVFNQAIKRNAKRFPPDFMFVLTKAEFENLISQNVISSGWGGRRRPPLAFTEHGAVMAANVLKSPRAIRMSVEVVRAFIQLRQFALTHEDLARKLAELEKKYDGQFEVVFDALRALMEPPEQNDGKPPVGFHTELAGNS